MEPTQGRPANQKSVDRMRVRGIAPAEWVTLGQAWFALLVIDVGLRTRGFPRVRQWPVFQVRRSHSAPASPTRDELNRVFHLVAIAAGHHLYSMLCLRRALVMQWLAARKGVAVEVRLGVARADSGVEAHAWVEWEGQVVGEEPDVVARYRTLRYEEGASDSGVSS